VGSGARAVTLRVAEIFHSLQGETSGSGFPTVFVRLTGCPMRCRYCDTAYAFHGGRSMTLPAILEAVNRYSARYVTVTGGEPGR
jgi:7-carboxy-7-deazaguanine synthase